MDDFTKLMNIRQKQFYVAICLRNFCRKIQVEHSSIHELVHHLASLIVENNIGVWEEMGSHLTISGRGDPIPNEIDSLVPYEYKKCFFELVESAVEVGIIDMCGSLSDRPDVFVHKCLKILERNSTPIPSPAPLFKLEGISEGWGEAISPELFEDLKKTYNLF